MKFMTRMMKRLSVVIAAALAFCALEARAGLPGDSVFVGVVYNLFHEEFAVDGDFFAQVDKDIPQMAESGFTHVLIFPLGEWDEATRSLKWVRTDYLIRAIEASGLKFVPLMFKEEQCSHYFPIWAFDEVEGLKATHSSNRSGNNNRENVDFADPRVWPYLERYFKAVVERYGSSPALAFYNIWNEPHYSSTAPHVVERFRKWVETKYGTLAAVNRAWGENYDEWQQVTPFLNDDWNSSMPGIDWTLFRNELNGTLLGELAAMLRRYDATRPINANPVGTPFTGGQEFGWYATDNWAFTQHNDFNGLSYYPDGWDRYRWPEPHPLWSHNLTFNLVRSASMEKEYILTELYTNAKNGLTLGGYLDPKTLDTLAWVSFANDCKGIIYWKWRPFMRGRQSLGRGLTRVDGELAERGIGASAMAKTILKEGQLIRAARPTAAKVAQIIDAVGVLKAMQQSVEGRARHFPLESHRGIFKALDDANIPSDTLRADLGLSLEQLRQYKVIALPFQIVMRRELADTLAQWVSEGGTLLADARTATVDELDYGYEQSPGGGLLEVFGARRIDWVATLGWHAVEYDLGHGLGEGRFEGKHFKEELELAAGTQTIGRFSDSGGPALTRNRYGKGVAYLSATPLGLSVVEEGASRGAEALVVAVCRAAGVGSPVVLEGVASGVSARLHVAPDVNGKARRLLYLISGKDEESSGVAYVPDAALSGLKVRSITRGVAVASESRPGGIAIPFTVSGRGVEVLAIE